MLACKQIYLYRICYWNQDVSLQDFQYIIYKYQKNRKTQKKLTLEFLRSNPAISWKIFIIFYLCTNIILSLSSSVSLTCKCLMMLTSSRVEYGYVNCPWSAILRNVANALTSFFMTSCCTSGPYERRSSISESIEGLSTAWQENRSPGNMVCRLLIRQYGGLKYGMGWQVFRRVVLTFAKGSIVLAWSKISFRFCHEINKRNLK